MLYGFPAYGRNNKPPALRVVVDSAANTIIGEELPSQPFGSLVDPDLLCGVSGIRDTGGPNETVVWSRHFEGEAQIFSQNRSKPGLNPNFNGTMIFGMPQPSG